MYQNTIKTRDPVKKRNSKMIQLLNNLKEDNPDPEADPEHAAGITYSIWPGNASGYPTKS